MAERKIFDCDDYKVFLASAVGPRDKRSGIKSAMAKAIKVQVTYLSQIIHGNAHLSLEQADLLSRFLGLNSEENDYFLLLVQKNRSGTSSLQEYFSRKLEDIRRKRMSLVERLGKTPQLSKEDQSIYYSSWHYIAVHMALTIPELRTKESISQFLGLSLKLTANALEFLTSRQLATTQGAEWIALTNFIRLGNTSHNIYKHHTNWRMQAIASLEREELFDLHYSSVLSLSKEDVAKLKERFLESIRETVQSVRQSKEEKLYCYCLDFFDLERT